jgi:hypothetical protein
MSPRVRTSQEAANLRCCSLLLDVNCTAGIPQGTIRRDSTTQQAGHATSLHGQRMQTSIRYCVQSAEAFEAKVGGKSRRTGRREGAAGRIYEAYYIDNVNPTNLLCSLPMLMDLRALLTPITLLRKQTSKSCWGRQKWCGGSGKGGSQTEAKNRAVLILPPCSPGDTSSLRTALT